MRITLNGSPVDLEGPLTLAALLERHRLKPEAVVVEHNLRVPPKETWAVTEIREGDRVEIVKFMGGG
jgi:sulfur carrier protein